MVSKYFRKAGVPQVDEAGKPMRDSSGQRRHRARKNRPSRSSTAWPAAGGIGAKQHGYFDTAEDAQAFYDEIAYMLLHQMCTPTARSGSTPA